MSLLAIGAWVAVLADRAAATGEDALDVAIQAGAWLLLGVIAILYFLTAEEIE